MLSSHWPQFAKVGDAKLTDAEMEIAERSFLTCLRRGLASPAEQRLYFDDGAEQDDRQYTGYKSLVDGVVTARGYRKDTNWMTRNFPGQPHNENSWASRVKIPLRFLLPLRKSRTR